ncbi:MAG: KH domain-containing protein [Chloroflexota bacterium]
MKTLIEYIAKSLVDHPEEVQVKEIRRGNSVNLILRVAKDDMGRVIGKSGRVANAVRVLLRVAAARSGVRATLDVEEPR